MIVARVHAGRWADSAKMMAAARAAEAHDFIMALPDGYAS